MAEKKTDLKTKPTIIRPTTIATTFSGRSLRLTVIQRLNLIVAGLYVVQALLLAMFGHGTRVPVTLNYLASDPLQSAAQNHTVLTLAAHHWFAVHVLMLVAAGLVLAALARVLAATVYRLRYESAMTAGRDEFRAAGYAVGGGVALVLVALLFGAADAAVLVAIIALCVVMALGSLAVQTNKRVWPWGVFGIVAGLGLWAIIGLYALGGFVYGVRAPGYAYSAAAVVLLGMVAVGVNLCLQTRATGRWRDPAFAEKCFIVLDFVCGTALVWIVFAGVLR
jgi:hypothetical protein